MFRPALIAALFTAAAFTAPAIAADGDRLRFVTQIQTKAAWRGVEVERIARSNDKLTIIGSDRNGREVVMEASCTDRGIDCPVTDAPVQIALITR